jgi:anti-anti-sigma factor
MADGKTSTNGVTVDRNVGGGATMATVVGRVGIEEANELQRRFDEVFRAGRPWVIVRLKDVDFVCSAGMGTLLSAVGEARKRGGEVIFTDVSAKVRTIFEFLDIWDYITTTADKDTALEMVAAGERKRVQSGPTTVALSFIADDVKAKLSEGIRLSKEGKVKDALAYFNAVIKADKNNVTALVWKGSVLERLGQFSEALGLYKRVADIGRGDAQLLAYAQGRLEKIEQRMQVATDREKAFERLRVAARALTQAPLGRPNFFIPERTVERGKGATLECYRTWDDGALYVAVRSELPYVRGGGYFVWMGDRGVVVNPGKNFVGRFAQAGRRLADVDAVIVIDVAWDQGADLEPLVDSFIRYNRVGEAPTKKLEILVSGPVQKKNDSWLSALEPSAFKSTILYPGHAYNLGDATLDVVALPEAGSEGVLGLLLSAGNAGFAYLGKVAGEDLAAQAAQYRSARGRVLLAHVGDVYVDENASSRPAARRRGIEAVGRLLSEVRPSLALLGNMVNVADPVALSEAVTEATDVRCLPVDLGLTVRLETSEVYTAAGFKPAAALKVNKGEDGRIRYNPAG